jgi:hypothetical protein
MAKAKKIERIPKCEGCGRDRADVRKRQGLGQSPRWLCNPCYAEVRPRGTKIDVKPLLGGRERK